MGALGIKLQNSHVESLPYSLKNILKVYNSRCISCLNKFDITAKGAKRFSKLQAPISTLTALRMLQPYYSLSDY